MEGGKKMDKELEEKMIQACEGLIKLLKMVFQGFRMPSEKSIMDAEEFKKEVQGYFTELTNFIVSKSSSSGEKKDQTKPFLSMASSFDRMTHNMEGIMNQLKILVQEHMGFSDHAVKEVNDIFQEAMNLLEKLPELILTQNKVLAQHIGEMVRSVFKIADGYSEEHEERLIRGICMPKSAPIYLGILESLKGVIANTLEVSGKIASLLSKS